MEQSTFPISRNLSLERLVTDALGEIERLGYSRRSRNRYRAIWEHLIEFSGRKRLGDQFSGELAARFLEEYRAHGEEIDMSGQGWRKHVVWGVSVLADFAENGRIERAFTDVEAIHLVPAMQNTLRDYVQYCKDRLQLRPGTLHERTIELTIFLDFLHSRKARTLDQIQSADLSDFLSCRADLPLVGKIRRDHWLQPIDSRANRFGYAFFSPVSDDAWDSAEGSQRGSAENPHSPGCKDPVGLGAGTRRQAFGGRRSQFGERQTRLRHSPVGLPIGIACWRHSYIETRSDSLGGFDNRSHAIENGHAIEAASDQRSG